MASAGPPKKLLLRSNTKKSIWTEDNPEVTRLKEDKERSKNWKRWGPYLSERQWGTVREDYSADGSWFVNVMLLFIEIVDTYSI